MELEKAIKKLKFMKWQYQKPPQNTVSTTFFEERQAIDTVLKELDNRIPIKKVENKIEEYKNLCHKEENKSVRSAYFHRYASLEELLYKE